MTADLSALIARLEAAEVGSRELDASVTVALQLDAKGFAADDHEYLRTTVRSDECAPGTYWLCVRSGMSLRTSDPVTTSLDSALALAERVLPGFKIAIVKDDGPEEGPELRWSVQVARYSLEGPVGRRGWWFGVADSPALALCIAILRAKQGEGA